MSDCRIFEIDKLLYSAAGTPGASSKNVEMRESADEGYCSAAGSSCLAASLKKQRQADESEFQRLFGPLPEGHHLLTLRKEELDSACKDHKHTRFAPNFRVYVVTRCVSDDELRTIVAEQRRSANAPPAATIAPESISSAPASTTTIQPDGPSEQSALLQGLYVNGRAPHEARTASLRQQSSSEEEDASATYAQYPPPSLFEPSTLQQACNQYHQRLPDGKRSPSPHKCPLWAMPSAFAPTFDDEYDDGDYYTTQQQRHSADSAPSTSTATFAPPTSPSSKDILADIHFSSSSDEDNSDENIDYVATTEHLLRCGAGAADDGAIILMI